MTGSSGAVLFGLLAALSWGAGDFLGGYTSRKVHLWIVLVVSQTAGLILVLITALLAAEPFPGLRDIAFGAISGLVGVVGLLSLYGGLARYPMGLIAPLSALITAAVPVMTSFVLEGLPGPLALAGLVLAAPAIYLVAVSPNGSKLVFKPDWKLLRYPVFAGLGFGGFFVSLDQISDGHVFWPIVAVRVASIGSVFVFSGWLRRFQPQAGQGAPVASLLGLIVLGGLFDAGGNVFFALATQTGRLDISAVVSSLFPGATVLLAAIFLKEGLSRYQVAGVVAALLAVVLFSI